MRGLLIIASMFSFSFLSAQVQWNYTITDVSHHVLIPSTVENISFQIGDYIGVFDSPGNDRVCVGYSEWTGENIALAVFGASLSYPGLVNGDELYFYHFDHITNEETLMFPVFNTIDFPNSKAFVVDGLSGVNSFTLGYIPGCNQLSAVNYDPNANADDGSCISVEQHRIDSLMTINSNLISEIEEITSSIENIHHSWNTKIDLDLGWNFIGYGCPVPKNLVEVLSQYADFIIVTKDNSGDVYFPEYDFNGIGDLKPGEGYQIKLTQSIENFNLCEWYINQLDDH